MLERLVAWAEIGQFGWQPDWGSDGPWLLLLLLLLGLLLPSLGIAWFDRWLAGLSRIDRVALAVRYGGFMNSWAVFGRGATDYRDLKPMFPQAEAAELARFSDGTACIVARFADAALARAAGTGAFGSFAAAGVQAEGGGLLFRTESRRGKAALPGSQQGQYQVGQWLVAEDTLFAFYGTDIINLTRRRRQLPCLKQPTLRPALAWLHGRPGFALLCGLWVGLLLAVLLPPLEASLAHLPLPASAVQDEDTLRARLQAVVRQDGGLQLQPGDAAGSFRIERRYDLPRFTDMLDMADFGRSVVALELRFDAASRSVNVLRLTARLPAPDMAGDVAPPQQWFNLGGLLVADPALPVLLREAVLAQGWLWRPRFFPLS